jgi:hypothetical protein
MGDKKKHNSMETNSDRFDIEKVDSKCGFCWTDIKSAFVIDTDKHNERNERNEEKEQKEENNVSSPRLRRLILSNVVFDFSIEPGHPKIPHTHYPDIDYNFGKRSFSAFVVIHNERKTDIVISQGWDTPTGPGYDTMKLNIDLISSLPYIIKAGEIATLGIEFTIGNERIPLPKPSEPLFLHGFPIKCGDITTYITVNILYPYVPPPNSFL